MAEDLLTAYFERDLKLKEFKALRRTLRSEEECQRFADKAARAYGAMKLPRPRYPGKHLGPWLAWGSGLALVGVAVLWLWTIRPMADQKAAELPVARRAENAAPALPEAVKKPSSASQTGLGLVVNQKQQGMVTVRILDENEKETRQLFAGVLDKGQWRFTWDGKMENGEPAEPGAYRIEARAGEVVDFKVIWVKK